LKEYFRFMGVEHCRLSVFSLYYSGHIDNELQLITEEFFFRKPSNITFKNQFLPYLSNSSQNPSNPAYQLLSVKSLSSQFIDRMLWRINKKFNERILSSLASSSSVISVQICLNNAFIECSYLFLSFTS
jgi:hypothetical protein